MDMAICICDINLFVLVVDMSGGSAGRAKFLPPDASISLWSKVIADLYVLAVECCGSHWQARRDWNAIKICWGQR